MSELFSDLTVAGIPLMFIVLGLTQYVKSFGVSGPIVRAVSLGIGLLMGLGYKLSSGPLPADFAGWFATIVFGLAVGLTASGVYDAGAQAARNKPQLLK